MSIYGIPILGRYAVLQNNKYSNKAERFKIKQKERVFFDYFSRKRQAFDPDQFVKPSVSDHEQLVSITQSSQEKLFTAHTVKPFALFNDTICIDRQKLTITHRAFFQTAKISCAQIKDIMNVEASLGPFFGSLTLTSSYFLNNVQTINFLRRSDVIKLQKLIQGFISANQAQINTDSIGRVQLTGLLNDLGHSGAD